MISIRWREGKPTVEAVCAKLGLKPDELDPRFGIVEIDPKDHLYTILVEHAAAKRIESKPDEEVEGPFSNPPIGPMGAPETPDEDSKRSPREDDR